MIARPSPPRCKCGCGACAPQGNQGGFASRACYDLWLLRQGAPLDDTAITALRLEGRSLEAIAKAVGRSEGMVRKRLRALGVTSPKRPVSPAHAKRVQRQAEAPADTRRYTKPLPWARIGTYQHPPLSAWTFGCKHCAQRVIGPLLVEAPGWKDARL